MNTFNGVISHSSGFIEEKNQVFDDFIVFRLVPFLTLGFFIPGATETRLNVGSSKLWASTVAEESNSILKY